MLAAAAAAWNYYTYLCSNWKIGEHRASWAGLGGVFKQILCADMQVMFYNIQCLTMRLKIMHRIDIH